MRRNRKMEQAHEHHERQHPEELRGPAIVALGFVPDALGLEQVQELRVFDRAPP